MAFGHRASVLWKERDKDPREVPLGKTPASLAHVSAMLETAVCESWPNSLLQGDAKILSLTFKAALHLV